MDAVIIQPKNDETKKKEDELLLEKELVETKMKEKKDPIGPILIIITLLLLLAVGAAAFQYFFNSEAPKEIIVENGGIAKSRGIRDKPNPAEQQQHPVLTEMQTPYIGFFLDSHSDLTQFYEERYRDQIAKYLNNKPKNHYFEFKKDGEIHGNYSIFVIEKNHKKFRKSLLLEYGQFSTECFNDNGYCMLGFAKSENGQKIKHIKYNSYAKNTNGKYEFTLSQDFIILLVKNDENEHDAIYDKIDEKKLYLNDAHTEYLKRHAVQAVFIGDFDEEDDEWIVDIKEKFNATAVPFNTQYKKSTSLCGNKWIPKTQPTPKAKNLCPDTAAQVSTA